MAVKLIANYAKRLGLPGFSSHQFSVSVETELTNVEDVAGESARLYASLQQAVNAQMRHTGFVPPDDYGMPPGSSVNSTSNGNCHSPGRPIGGGGNGPNEALTIVKEHTAKIDLLVSDVILLEMHSPVVAQMILASNPASKSSCLRLLGKRYQPSSRGGG